MIQRTLTVKEISKKLGYTEYWIRKLAQQGKIPATKRSKGKTCRWMFNHDEVLKAMFQENTYV